MAGKKKKEEIEGKFEIKPENRFSQFEGKTVGRFTLSELGRLKNVAEMFANVPFDQNRKVSEVFKRSDGRCFLLGLVCDEKGPCLQCEVGQCAKSELKSMIEVCRGK